MKSVNNLKKQMMEQDIAKVRGMTSVDEVVNFVNTEYCGLNYAVENTLKPINFYSLMSWKNYYVWDNHHENT